MEKIKKGVFEDYLFTIQVVLDWMLFENRLRYLNFYDDVRYMKDDDKDNVIGCFVTDGTWTRYYYDLGYFKWFAKNHNKEMLDEMIDFVHHEMVHYYCYMDRTLDTKGNFHTEAFRLQVERCGGICEYDNDEYGWTITQLRPEIRAQVKHVLKHLFRKGKKDESKPHRAGLSKVGS